MFTWQSGQKEREKRLNRERNRWEMGNEGKEIQRDRTKTLIPDNLE